MNPLLNSEDVERKILLILRILKDSPDPLGARLIARRMEDFGVVLSERAVRYHLKLMDERGLTRLVGRRDGRLITEMGIDEIANARVRDKVGLAISRIESLAYRTTFDPATMSGALPVNVSFFPRAQFDAALAAMAPAFRRGFAVSDLVAVADEGQRLGEVLVPADRVGFATVCSIVVNGVLLKNGIPMDSKFGGILQVKNGRVLRFVELIYYSGSSLDPSEVFILGRMTSVQRVIETGEGKILANFREIPALSRGLAEALLVKLQRAGIRGALTLGEISEPVGQTPVDVNKVGVILIGGLNPVACAHESGIVTENRAMSTVLDFHALQNFWYVLESRGLNLDAQDGSLSPKSDLKH